jgi:hypothetical protein
MKESIEKSIYVVTHDYTTLTKVGMSNNVTTRIKAIRTSVGADLQIYYESPLMKNAFIIEQEILKHFAEKRIYGEWINETPENIISFIKTIEHKFDREDCISVFERLEINDGASEIGNPFTRIIGIGGNSERIAVELKEIERGIYLNKYNYTFIVCFTVSNFKEIIAFHSYRDAKVAVTKFKDRVIKLDLENKEFIKNPNIWLND